MKKNFSPDVEKMFFVTSDRLSDLRLALKELKKINIAVGVAARFRLVVDTNIVLGDLRWLVSAERASGAKTGLMELIEADTVDLYAPPIFFVEVEEKIPLLAIEQGLNEKKMLQLWQGYKECIKLSSPDPSLVDALDGSVDPDDVQFVALERTIRADGILSKDKHISMMGGNRIALDFIIDLRNYSRSTAIEMNIKVGGVRFAIGGVGAFRICVAGIKMLLQRLNSAPDWLKIALLIGGLLALAHPSSREKIRGVLQTLFSNVAEATPSLLSFISTAATTAHNNQLQAEHHLNNVLRQLSNN